MSDNAIVKTLTAEVRTLVVGNRQVTLSVYSQLDWTKVQYIDPFGRINAKDRWERNFLCVIGRCTVDGALARARISPGATGPTEELFEKWRKLPLIVLAGLR